MLAQNTGGPCLIDGISQAFHGDGILRAHVDVTLGSADGVTAQHHTFDDAVGIALQQAAVHKCARIALVGVTDHELAPVPGHGLHARLPLHARGEACAAAAPEARVLDNGHHVLLTHAVKGLGKGRVTVPGHIGFQGGEFHLAAVAQGDADLALEETDVLHFRHMDAHVVVKICILLADLIVHQVLQHHVLHLFRVHFRVEHAVRLNQDHGAKCAGAHTAGDQHLHLVLQFVGLKRLEQGVLHVLAVGGNAARASAHQHLPFVLAAAGQVFFFDRGQIGGALYGQVFPGFFIHCTHRLNPPHSSVSESVPVCRGSPVCKPGRRWTWPEPGRRRRCIGPPQR